jgi:hypothetical protein
MKNKIIKIIEQGIGEDKIKAEIMSNQYLVESGYNQALADLRAKAPEIAQEILDSVVGEIESLKENFNINGRTVDIITVNMIKNRIINHLTK